LDGLAYLTADEASIRLSPEAFEADLLAAAQVWQPYVSSSLRWLRPGMGFYSASMVATAQRHGYRLALGSVFPYDTHVPFSGFAIAFILSTVQPGDIIVLHDGESKGSAEKERGGKGRGQRTL
jgi:peptidoglycan-N-acetylglucosamine deacetylase